MYELLKLRDGYLDFSGVFHLDQSRIATLIDFVATAWFIVVFVFALFCLALCTLYVLL